jgi:hypothetical protein
MHIIDASGMRMRIIIKTPKIKGPLLAKSTPITLATLPIQQVRKAPDPRL